LQKIPYPDNSFDAVYAIEATVHAPSLQGVYSEILRVLKPGGVFGVYEWLMTDEYDNENLEHRRIRLDIEQGDGIAQMFNIEHGLSAMKDAGFELQVHEDLAATDEGPAPWYWPLDSNMSYAQTLGDVLTVLRMNKWGRLVMHNVIGVLEAVRLAPAGTRKTADSLGKAADALVEGGKQKLFTPMYLMVGKKPSA
jgi:sterol 24-C-methyltransferase